MPMRVLEMRKVVLSAAVVLAAVAFAPAQDDGHFSLGVGYTGVFSKTSASSTNSTSLKPTTSGGVLGTFRYQFNHRNGIEVNIGHTNNSQVFTIPPDTFRVGTGITEFSADYVLSPFHGKRLNPFFLAGGGMLRFSAGSQYIDDSLSAFGAKNQTAPAGLYGGGVEYHLWRLLTLRVQYRGLIYRAPDFSQTRLFTGAYGHMAEPTAGLVIKF
jgi:outer membrane immunogenic protein